MRKEYVYLLIAMIILTASPGCNPGGSDKKEKEIPDSNMVEKGPLPGMSPRGDSLLFYYRVAKDTVNCRLPAIQSFAIGEHNGLWIFIGGEKAGFHGRVSHPAPFPANKANDSIWVVDFVRQQSWSVAVPSSYSKILSAMNPAFCQVGDSLYLCGGFTRNADGDKNFNFTSSNFLEMNMGRMVEYVQGGGRNLSFSRVVTKNIQDPFVQVTGGELVYTNGYFYLIGGHNYQRIYAIGTTGAYTNAIRRFRLQELSTGRWGIGSKASLTDTVNLHRRDMNLVFLPGNDHAEAILYGGVFTSQEEAFRNAIFINGLSTGTPSIKIDSLRQTANQYSCANICLSSGASGSLLTTFFGGISYVMYDSETDSLEIGDKGRRMPWSNLISTVASNNGVIASREFIQLPPNAPLLPKYMGANAAFIPLESYRYNGSRQILDAGKVMKNTNGSQVLVGFIFGGIISGGPTSGTTPDSTVRTFPNPDLYKVYVVIK